jgi:hypothetical protein
MLARYAYRYDRKHKRLQAVDQPQIERTVFADPQLELWELDNAQWHKMVERAAHPRLTKPAGTTTAEQLSFNIAGLILPLLTCSFCGLINEC